MIISKRADSRGFTLIETVLYSALIAMTIGAVMAITYQIVGNSKVIADKIASGEEAAFVAAKIKWALANALRINSPALGTSSSTLSLSLVDYPRNPVVFYSDGGIVYIQKQAGVSAPLTDNRTVIDGLIFTHIPAIRQKPEGVRISFFASGNQYETTFFLRK